jgi:hypothetical protein
MTQKCYKIELVYDLENLLKKNSKSVMKYDSILETNKAYLYFLKSGEVILIPNSFKQSSKGILFYNQECLKECIKQDFFPLDNEKPRIEELHQDEILQINIEINSIVHKLCKLTNCESFKNNNDSSTLANLLKKVKNVKSKISKTDLFYSALALGEYLRIVNKGRWILLKKYGTFNPYYVPAILYEDNSIVLFWDFLLTFFESSTITPEIYCNLPYIKHPSLKLGNYFFKNNFHNYKILD